VSCDVLTPPLCLFFTQSWDIFEKKPVLPALLPNLRANLPGMVEWLYRMYA
jgi:uncharacterized membrane protein